MEIKTEHCETYLHQRTLIVGESNSGKTTLTDQLLDMFIHAGYASEIAILDLAPDKLMGVGGKMRTKPPREALYLSTLIAAPRLQGKNNRHVWQLAQTNARATERQFKQLIEAKRKILFVNDATLYLQAGAFEHFEKVLNSFHTAIINAYEGDRFGDSALTRREKKLTRSLKQRCDLIIRL